MTPEFLKRYPDYPEMPRELEQQINEYRKKVSEWRKRHPRTTETKYYTENGQKYLLKQVFDDAGRLVQYSSTHHGTTPLDGWSIQFHSKERVEVVRFNDYEELRDFAANNSPK